jgi:hypothetical protein
MFVTKGFPGKKFENLDALDTFLKKRKMEKAKLLIIKNLAGVIKTISIKKLLKTNEISNKE